jgi:hypothetical protein
MGYGYRENGVETVLLSAASLALYPLEYGTVGIVAKASLALLAADDRRYLTALERVSVVIS